MTKPIGAIPQDAVAAETRKALTAAFQAADDDWQERLISAFGRWAGAARYEWRGRGEDGTPLRAAYDARNAARIKLEAVR